MSYSRQEIYDTLYRIFIKYKKRYKNPPKSMQLCCMWSVTRPPDIIEDTPPFNDIEDAFSISLDDDDCLDLYNMELDEATDKIADLIQDQS